MRICVLGPLRVTDHGTVGQTQRRLLAMLAAKAGNVVSAEALADGLHITPAAVRTAVHRARDVVGDVILSAAPGYILQPAAVDATRFMEMASAIDDSVPTRAIAAIDSALSLWQGPAFVEFAAEDWAQGRATALNETRASLAEQRASLLIVAGRFDEAIADAQDLISEGPYREGPRRVLMIALASVGRTTEALRAFQDFRRFLVESAGTEPTQSLFEVDGQITRREIAPTGDQLVAVEMRTESTIPSGVVTFLFTDVESSTALWAADADSMSASLALHDQLLRHQITEHRGYVFATAGDAFCAAFERVSEAVAAATAIQRALEDTAWLGPQLRVRIALHLGETVERGGDYFGAAVNNVARVVSAAHGGQALVTDQVRLAGQLDEVVDLGMHALKDVIEPVRLFQLGPGEYPPLRTPPADAVGSAATDQQLPHPATEWIGSATSLTEHAVALSSHRLHTLTGPGGVGKTRLAIELGHAVAREWRDGVRFIDLSTINTADAVLPAIATALDVQPQPTMTLGQAIIDWARAREFLLILDNCEHVLEPVRDLASTIAEEVETVGVLATSREALRVAGERVIPVAPLDSDKAIALFLDRAGAADTSQAFGPGDRPIIQEVCERLEGLPLAIELAAARTRTMTLDELRDRLEDQLRLLGISSGDVDERHQTLRATIDWSHRLLDPTTRVVFAALSVFAKGFDIAGAEEVCADVDSKVDVFDAVTALVEKSMLVADRRGRTTRYRMLEELRQFAAERLAELGDRDRCRRGFRDHLVQLAEAARAGWMSQDQPAIDAVFDVEWANLRSAFRQAVEDGDTSDARRLLIATAPAAFCRLRHEHATWADRLLELDDGPDPYVHGLAVRWAWAQLEHDKLVENAERGIALAPADDTSASTCRAILGLLHLVSGSRAAFEQLVPSLLRDLELLDDPYERSLALFPLALSNWPATPKETGAVSSFVLLMCEEARSTGSPSLQAAAEFFRGAALMTLDPVDFDGLESALRLSVEMAQEAGDKVWLAQALTLAARAAVASGATNAAGRCRQAIAHAYDARFWVVVGFTAPVAAAALAAAGRLEAAAVAEAAIEANFDIGTESNPDIPEERGLSSDNEALTERGRRFGREELVEFLIEQLKSVESS